MNFNIKILGAGSAVPLKGRHHSSQLVSVFEHKYLIDCGEGTQYRLIEEKVNLNKIEAVFISHLHGDHFYGLIGLISTMSLMGRKSILQIFAPAGFNDVVILNFKLSGTVLDFDLTVSEIAVTGKEVIFDDKNIAVYSFPIKHGITAFGFLIEEKRRPLKLIKNKINRMSVEEMIMLKQGSDVTDDNGQLKYSVRDYTLAPDPVRSYAYCSDTIYDETIVPYIKKVSLLYHEATYLNEHQHKAVKNRHSTALEAAMIAKKAEVKKLMIGHLSSRYEGYEVHLSEAKSLFEATIPAIEGKSISL